MLFLAEQGLLQSHVAGEPIEPVDHEAGATCSRDVADARQAGVALRRVASPCGRGRGAPPAAVANDTGGQVCAGDLTLTAAGIASPARHLHLHLHFHGMSAEDIADAISPPGAPRAAAWQGGPTAIVLIIGGLIYLTFHLGAGHAPDGHRRAQVCRPTSIGPACAGPTPPSGCPAASGSDTGSDRLLSVRPARMLAGGRLLGSVRVSAPGAVRHLQLCGVGHILEPRPVLACAPAEVKFRLAKYPHHIP